MTMKQMGDLGQVGPAAGCLLCQRALVEGSLSLLMPPPPPRPVAAVQWAERLARPEHLA
jgi:hypothetical protein